MKNCYEKLNVMSEDILRVNQLVEVVSRCLYLYKNILESEQKKITMEEFVLHICRNYYLNGTLCWQDKEINGINTYITFEIDHKDYTVYFKDGFTDINLSFGDVTINKNQLYNIGRDVFDIVYKILENRLVHIYVDSYNIISNTEVYKDGSIFNGVIIKYSMFEINEKLRKLDRYL